MKKLDKVLAPILGLGLLAGVFGVVSAKNNKAEKVSATDPVVEKFIPVYKENFRAEGFDNYLGNNTYGHGDFERCIRNRFDTYWQGRLYNSQHNIIDTIHGAGDEARTGGIRSKEFVFNGGPYISFLLGGNANNKVNIFDVTRGFDVYYNIRPVFKNSQLSVNMQFKYFKLPETLRGHTFLIYIEDSTGNPFGGVTFADLQINLTYEELGKAFSAHKANLSRMDCAEGVSNNDVRDYCLNFYTNYGGANKEGDAEGDINLANYSYNYRPAHVDDGGIEQTISLTNYYTEAMEAEDSIENLNEGFEINNSMMFWAYDQTYEDGRGSFRIDYASSDASNHPFNNDLPFNKTGNRFFKGYDENGTGFENGDQYKYRFLSSTFTFKGSGYISVKMAGSTAKVFVLNGDSTSANYLQELKSFDVQTFKIKDDENIGLDAGNVLKSGFNSCTMVRHIIDLRDLIDENNPKKLILAIADTGNGDWGAVNFDEIITYYQTAPSFKIDVASQSGMRPFYVDKFVSSDNTTDMAKAAAFLETYYSNARARGTAGATYCYDSTAMGTVNSAYNLLSAEVKAIVDAAMDIDYGANTTWGMDGETPNAWWKNTPTTTGTVGASMANIASKLAQQNGNAVRFNVNNSSNTTTIIIISAIVALSAVGFFFLRRKQEK